MQYALRRVRFAALIAVFFGIAGDAAALAQQREAPAESATRIEALIKQLDDDSFQAREKAQAALVEIGQPAVAALTAATKDASAERAQRAAKVLALLKRDAHGLKHLQTVQHAGLLGAVTAALSPDGNFLYVPAFQTNAIHTFRCDAVTGKLEHRAMLADPIQLAGVVTLRLSKSGKLAVAASFRGKSITLLGRNVDTGELAILSVRRHQDAGPLQMEWPIDAIVSTDERFVYAVDDRGAKVIVLAVEDGKRLNVVETFEGRERCFDGARGVVAHPDGKTLYVSSRRPGTLAVLDRDPASGKLAVRQLIRDGDEGVTALAGTTGACVSRDGKFVYTISGRFEGDNAVGVFQVGADGKLAPLQEFISDQSDLKNLTGPNELAISPDGKHLYASGTTSCSLACFQRDAATGKLTFVATMQDAATGAGADLGANGVDLSPDGRFLYLALENGSAVSVFERAP
jgi:6-phosphogluconolactonase (cycloisomerase 2 family)